VIEKVFENNLEPQKRYVLRGEGALAAEVGTITLVRDRNHCAPSPPPLPRLPPPSHPFLAMQTQPLYLVSFTASVDTTVEEFDVLSYAQRMSEHLGVPEVEVSVAPGSVIVTTTAGADDQSAANALVLYITNMASSSNSTSLSELYGAPAEVDPNSITVIQNTEAVMPPWTPSLPPPSPPPPSKSDDDHVLLAIVIILAIMVPTSAFLVYLRFAQSPTLPKSRSKPYASVTTSDLPTTRQVGKVSFKFEM